MMNEETNDAATAEPKVYQIPVENMPALNEKLAKLNKRAAKLGCEAIVLTIVGEKMVEVQDHRPEDEDYDDYNRGRYEHVIQLADDFGPRSNGFRRLVAGEILEARAANLILTAIIVADDVGVLAATIITAVVANRIGRAKLGVEGRNLKRRDGPKDVAAFSVLNDGSDGPTIQLRGSAGNRNQDALFKVGMWGNVTLKKVIGHEGSFGLTTIHIMVDENGNRMTWFKSGCSDMEEGKTYVLKGTVKSHEVYNKNKDYNGNPLGVGENQTILSRCKIVREIAPEPVDASVMNIFA